MGHSSSKDRGVPDRMCPIKRIIVLFDWRMTDAASGSSAAGEVKSVGNGGDLPPNHTLYCNNLNDKIKIEGLLLFK